ncbi:hypothetical protein E4665_05315 [Sporolactobacillus shoreae]|uniref:Uncharacterized protein n=1 Tax=Sporolactobacillus shoreae TaxID=1465501 RepID=A0A4Z0GQY2_9BACL|nr:hypothetical protein [Sporolactobacillus shoreae]TGA99203.1 hypothetical protein E4665_05315 [Sporolactobacillus shoreae]
MESTEFARNIALLSIATGKVMGAISKTPTIRLKDGTRGQLLLSSGLIQFGGGALLTETISADPSFQFVVDLNFLNYGIFALQLLQNAEDSPVLIRQALSANLREVVSGIVLLTNGQIRKKLDSSLEVMLIALGHFMQSLGRQEQFQQKKLFNDVNRFITTGSWIDVGGSAVILLGNLRDTA